MAKEVPFQVFGQTVTLLNEITYTPPGGKKALKASVLQDTESEVFYINNFILPVKLQDATSKIVNMKPEERMTLKFDDIIGASGTLRALDKEFGDSMIVGVLIATAAISTDQKVPRAVMVVYAPNQVNITSSKYPDGYMLHTNESMKLKGTFGQCHFERTAAEQVKVFLDHVMAVEDKVIQNGRKNLSVHLEMYFHSTQGTTDVCDTCRGYFKDNFFAKLNGTTNWKGIGSGAVEEKPKAKLYKCDKCGKIPGNQGELRSASGKSELRCTKKGCAGTYVES
jgi:hypothetical protein